MDDEEAWFRVRLPNPGVDLLAEVILTAGLDINAREVAIDHPSISDHELIAIMRKASDGPRTRCLISTSRSDVLLHWLVHGNADERMAAAANPAGDARVALMALSDVEERVRLVSIYSPSLTDEQVRWHRQFDPSVNVREAAHDALETELGRHLRSGEREVFLVEIDECNMEDEQPPDRR